MPDNMCAPFQIVFGRACEDRSLQETPIRPVDLDRTIAKPGVPTSGPRSDRCRIRPEGFRWRDGMISRAGVVELLVRQIGDGAHSRGTTMPIN